jgi:hypothetical protein
VTPGAAPYQTLTLQSPDSADVAKNGHQRARVLYDYDAKDATELSLMADEVTVCSYACVFSTFVMVASCSGSPELKSLHEVHLLLQVIFFFFFVNISPSKY